MCLLLESSFLLCTLPAFCSTLQPIVLSAHAYGYLSK